MRSSFFLPEGMIPIAFHAADLSVVATLLNSVGYILVKLIEHVISISFLSRRTLHMTPAYSSILLHLHTSRVTIRSYIPEYSRSQDLNIPNNNDDEFSL